jgi:N-ethylmaleimide reductase
MAGMTVKNPLLNAFDLDGLRIKNRVVLSPMTRARAGAERRPNALMAEYYTQRASAGLLITEGTHFSDQAIGWVNSPGIYTDEQAEDWKGVVDAVHAKGTPIFLQLWHCGRASHSSFHKNGELPVAPSAIRLNETTIHTPLGNQPLETPRALETNEIAGIVEDFRQGAERAMTAGFDGVEIHSANGYLVDEFLQSKTNHRTDRYGGSPENRYRFLDEIVTALLPVFPERVGVHLSPNGRYNDMGSLDFRETFLYVAEQLNRHKLSYLHVVDGLANGFHGLGEPMTLAEFRKVFTGPLIGNSGYTQEKAEAAIGSGQADLISFGRPFISNPDLVERFANSRPLNPPADMAVWFSFDRVGYTDFPRYEASEGKGHTL